MSDYGVQTNLYLSIYLSIHLSIYLSISLFIYLSISLYDSFSALSVYFKDRRGRGACRTSGRGDYDTEEGDWDRRHVPLEKRDHRICEKGL